MRFRRTRPRRLLLTALAMLMVAATGAACGNDRPDNELLVWTSLGGEIDMAPQRQIIAEFEKRNPGVKVQIVPKSGRFTGDNTALIAAVRAKEPPDVFITDRFTVANQASIGLLTNLSELAGEEADELAKQYLPFAIAEASYNGDLYALPFDTDARGLYYNKQVLRDAGIDPDVLDPRHGPPTIAEVMEIADKITQTDERGNYTRLGIIPWDGQAFHATWGLINRAQWYDEKTCEITATSPGWLKTFRQFDEWARKLDFQKVQAYLATYRPPNADPSTSPFYTGRLGMAIDGNWQLASIKKYAPDLDFGVTWLPVPEEGDPPLTWSGGFALVMPKGVKNPDLVWKFMKFYAGEEGQRIYAKGASKIPTWKSLINDESVTGEQGIFPSMMEHSTNRPALPVGAQISDAMDAAQSGVLLGELTPEEATQQVQDRVGPQMKQFCPFTLT
ncbi:ABC transporter substrate-binding protein [Thermasporomyces composti]|jgi:multiple sugar transport system substrate-binding protein|uniref:Carbohydrate ABC transporter substrate-binding protein (CUT1 family) n=1 Tax=Thermasporomyces composti TaxID=696763 RepID=A0A3D9VC21_THECX|nr:ABC transporter substrate-binding protein [Thermasporomyces composti]REF34841.1 carbohydrate ABC transporter substrate-binding protein (CUT1 family) [Thermasporomyces composti]